MEGDINTKEVRVLADKLTSAEQAVSKARQPKINQPQIQLRSSDFMDRHGKGTW